MKRRTKKFFEGRGIFYATATFLLFTAAVLLLLGGMLLYQINGDFYAAFRGGLHQGFYYQTIAVLAASSFVYAPFSFGISRYFIGAAQDASRFSDLFYLFRKPRMLAKAALLTLLKKLLTYWERLLLLLLAAMAEVGLFWSFLVLSGEDIFSLGGNPFVQAGAFMLRSPQLIFLSIVLWSGVLFGFFIIFLRYILCKYVLICFPDVGVFQAIRVAKISIRGEVLRTLLFYLRYSSYVLLTMLTFGTFGRRRGVKHRTFSIYACDLVHVGWGKYCDRRSGRG